MANYTVISKRTLQGLSEPSVMLRGWEGGPKARMASTESLRVLWQLEARGFSVWVEDGKLEVRSPEGNPLRGNQLEQVRSQDRSMAGLVQYVEAL